MAELPETNEIATAQVARMLTLQEAQIRELSERVKSQGELIEALGAGLTALCDALPAEGAAIAARLRDLMFDHKKLTDRAQPL